MGLHGDCCATAELPLYLSHHLDRSLTIQTIPRRRLELIGHRTLPEDIVPQPHVVRNVTQLSAMFENNI